MIKMFKGMIEGMNEGFDRLTNYDDERSFILVGFLLFYCVFVLVFTTISLLCWASAFMPTILVVSVTTIYISIIGTIYLVAGHSWFRDLMDEYKFIGTISLIAMALFQIPAIVVVINAVVLPTKFIAGLFNDARRIVWKSKNTKPKPKKVRLSKKELARNLEECQSEMSNLSVQISNLTKLVEERDAEVAKLEWDKELLSQEIEALKGENSDYMIALDDIQYKISQLLKEDC